MKNRIRLTEIISFWCEWVIIQIVYGFVIIIAIPLFPIAYLLRYQFEVKWNPLWWVLNDETDFGEQWWLEREGLTEGVKSAFKWWRRNPCWNFNNMFKPKWTGDYTDLRVIKNTLTEERESPLDWADRYKYRWGVNHVYYRVEGTVFGRYSYASTNIEIRLGSGGKRYKLWVKL